MESFLARPVGQTEEVITIPALTLGILNAGSARSDRGPEHGA